MALAYLITESGAYLVTEGGSYLIVGYPLLGWLVPGGGNVWSVPMLTTGWQMPAGLAFGWTWEERNVANPADISRVLLKSYPSWNSTWFFEFKNLPQIQAGQTISAVNSVTQVAGAGTLTLGTGSISGTQVLFKASGGTAGVAYTIQCSITLSGGDVVTWEGDLYRSN